MIKQIVPTLCMLVVASIVGTVMVVLRWKYSGNPAYAFLVWNIFLAWLPLLVALTAPVLRHYPPLLVATGGFWLLLFPNAPYILTDFIHLGRRYGAPLWYDLLLLLTFAFTGLMLGFVSLNIMQTVVSDWLGRKVGWLFAIACLVLSSVGIYIGRFMRWNSWDAWLRPVDLTVDLLRLLYDPWTNKSAYVFSLLLSGLLVFTYVMLRTLPRQEMSVASTREK